MSVSDTRDEQLALLAHELRKTLASLAVETRGRCAEVTVRDSGAGIAPEMLDEIFGRLRQEHRGSHGGLGLGLPIAKGLVELHGGSIAAESGGPGTGCTLRIELPIAAAAPCNTRPGRLSLRSGRRTRIGARICGGNG